MVRFINKTSNDEQMNISAVPVTAQGLPNGEAAALQHAAYPGMQPFPGVGESLPPANQALPSTPPPPPLLNTLHPIQFHGTFVP